MKRILTNIVASGDPKRVVEIQLATGQDSKKVPVKADGSTQGAITCQIVTGRDPKRVLLLQ